MSKTAPNRMNDVILITEKNSSSPWNLKHREIISPKRNEYMGKWDCGNDTCQYLAAYLKYAKTRMQSRVYQFMFTIFIELLVGMFKYFQYWYKSVDCEYVMFSMN